MYVCKNLVMIRSERNSYSIYNDDENADDYNDHDDADDGTYCFYYFLYRFVSISIG